MRRPRLLGEITPLASTVIHCRKAVPVCGPSITRYFNSIRNPPAKDFFDAPSHEILYSPGCMSSEGSMPPRRNRACGLVGRCAIFNLAAFGYRLPEQPAAAGAESSAQYKFTSA